MGKQSCRCFLDSRTSHCRLVVERRTILARVQHIGIPSYVQYRAIRDGSFPEIALSADRALADTGPFAKDGCQINTFFIEK